MYILENLTEKKTINVNKYLNLPFQNDYRYLDNNLNLALPLTIFLSLKYIMNCINQVVHFSWICWMDDYVFLTASLPLIWNNTKSYTEHNEIILRKEWNNWKVLVDRITIEFSKQIPLKR